MIVLVGETIISLNPVNINNKKGTYVIPNTIENNVFVYLICEDSEVAEKVATYNMSEIEISEYTRFKESQEKKEEKDKDECI